jgi:hypothetical protein
MTKTLSPVLRPAVEPPPLDELVADEPADVELEVVEPLELQAASATVAATGSARSCGTFQLPCSLSAAERGVNGGVGPRI